MVIVKSYKESEMAVLDSLGIITMDLFIVNNFSTLLHHP